MKFRQRVGSRWPIPVTSRIGIRPRQVYVDGKQVATLEGDTLADDFKRMIEEYVAGMPEAG